MSSPKSIPSKLNANSDLVSCEPQNEHLYITAVLFKADIEIDGRLIAEVGPVTFPSPIQCETFKPSSAGQVAYFEQ